MIHKYSTIVIGGGAAGMIAAWRAASSGAKVILLEKNNKLGIKIRISGGGKCNITNGRDIREMLKMFQVHENRFLKYSFHAFSNVHLLKVLQQHGVETYTRENGKVFPITHNAKDVVSALEHLMQSANLDVRLNTPVMNIEQNTNDTILTQTDKETFLSENVIVAVGGASYKKTGTTGDGYPWAKKLGHTIIPIRPALSPIHLSPKPFSVWQGTPVRDCSLISICGKKVITKNNGDVLFTHFGLSGPAALEISKETFLYIEHGKHVTLHIDFYPELTLEQLETKILLDVANNPTQHIFHLIERYVPQRLSEYVLLQSDVDGDKKSHQLKKVERSKIIAQLKSCNIGTVSDITLDQGEVTAGGIALNEINPTSMESKIIKGLYFCGEILDIAGPIGGYNLQAAFSTGFVAGTHAANKNHSS